MSPRFDGPDEVLGNQAEMLGVVEQAPAPDGARRHATVRECDDQRRALFQNSPGFADHLTWPGQMLDSDADRCGVELGGGKRQVWIAVQILDVPLVEKRIFCQLLGIEAELRRPSANRGFQEVKWLTQPDIRSRMAPPGGRTSR